jgi:exodeoxyribonuclease V alpha subunit
MQHRIMLRRNLIYTAVTRAKKILVLVGSPKALWAAVQTVDQDRSRFTGLQFRLQNNGTAAQTSIEDELVLDDF